MAAATANRSRILDWLKVRLALRNMNRMSRTSAALFEPGVETLTVEEHDRRNAFNRLAKMEELGLLTQHGPDFPHNRTHTLPPADSQALPPKREQQTPLSRHFSQ